MEDYHKLRFILNEFDDRIIDRLSCVVEEDVLYCGKETKIHRIIEFCLSNDSKKSKDLQEILFAYAEKYLKLLEDFNSKKDQTITNASDLLEVYIISNWKYQ